MKGRALPMLFLGLALAATPVAALAQDSLPDENESEGAAPASDTEARQRFQRGTERFDAGDYAAAAAEFQAAYELSRRPALLYNIYLANERRGELPPAIEALERYLVEGEPGDRRDSLEQRLERLRERHAAEEAEDAEQRERERRLEAAATADRDEGPGALPWIVAASGAALAVGGVVLLALAQIDIAAVESPSDPMPMWADVEGAYDRAPVLSTIGAILLGVGGAAVAVGLGWGIASGGTGVQEAQVSIGPGSVSLRGRF